MRSFNSKFIYLFVLLSILFLQSCSNADAEQKKEANTSDSKYIKIAKNTTKIFKLTTLPMPCLIYKELGERFEGKVMIDVREKHGGSCGGGNPATSPRLFSIGVDESTGEIWSDAKSLVGQLEKLKK